MNAHFATPLVRPERRLADARPTASTPRPTSRRPARRCRGWSGSRRRRGSTASTRPPPTRASRRNGNEVAWGTIGNASCAEGMFWESVNAIGVLQAPAVISIWDDGYGISVPNELQITKGDLSALLSGFQRDAGAAGRLRRLHACAAGTTRRSSRPTARRRRRRARARAGDRPRRRDDAAAGPLDLRQPRALQVGRAAALGGGARLRCSACAPGCSTKGSPAARSSRRSTPRSCGWCARRSGGPGTPSRSPSAPRRASCSRCSPS